MILFNPGIKYKSRHKTKKYIKFSPTPTAGKTHCQQYPVPDKRKNNAKNNPVINLNLFIIIPQMFLC